MLQTVASLIDDATAILIDQNMFKKATQLSHQSLVLRQKKSFQTSPDLVDDEDDWLDSHELLGQAVQGFRIRHLGPKLQNFLQS